MKQKYCLDSAADFRTINQSSTNKSKTKATFSFGRSSRFEPVKKICPTASYGGDTIHRKNSGASIGYGKKSDFTKCQTISPSCSKYQMKSQFDSNRQSKKGFTLNLSREDITFDGYISKSIAKNPSSNNYVVEPTDRVIKSRAPCFSMRKKTKALDLTKTIEAQNMNPSPGDYENNPEGYSSRYGTKFNRISYGTSRQKRFNNSNNHIPGPGDYENISSLSNAGKYIISSHQGGTIAKFNHQKRVTKFDEAKRSSSFRPGPGQYGAPSQFGQYHRDSNARTSSRRKL